MTDRSIGWMVHGIWSEFLRREQNRFDRFADRKKRALYRSLEESLLLLLNVSGGNTLDGPRQIDNA